MLAITTATVLAQAVGVWLTGSLALVADTVEKTIDLAALVLALVVEALILRPATSARSWGMRRLEVIAGAVRAAITVGLGVFVVLEGITRLRDAPEVMSRELLVFGLIGLLANVIKVLVLKGTASSSFHMRSLILDVWNDTLGSIGIIVAAIIMRFTGGNLADVVVGMVIAAFIIPRAWRLLSETINVLMEGTPPGLDVDGLRGRLLEVPGVRAVHDLHASMISGDTTQLTAHIVADDSAFTDGRAEAVLDGLETVAADSQYAITHTTFQIESAAHNRHEATHAH